MQLGVKQIGIILLGMTVVLSILIVWYTPTIMQNDELQCEAMCGVHSVDCPHANNLPVQTYLGITLVIILGFLSYSLITSSKLASKVKKEILEKINKLPPEEKSIYNKIESADGAMLQSEIVDKSGLSKVKVTRILDKLEAKRLVERRRRGMTNLVILKRD